MKKIAKLLAATLLLILGSFNFLFADAKNIVFSKTINFSTIDTLEVSLVYEQLQITRIYGEEIIIEIGSNDIKRIPEVLSQDGTLKIQSKEKKAPRGIKCNVYIYLPQDFIAQSINISNVSGNISADFLYSQNNIVIGNISGRTDIGNCQTEMLMCTSVSGNSTVQKITADYFDFSSTSGNIFAQLEQAPQATSSITNISGKSQLYYPKNSDFDIIAFTISGSIKTDDSAQKNNGTNYSSIIGAGGAQISINSVSGRIEFIGY